MKRNRRGSVVADTNSRHLVMPQSQTQDHEAQLAEAAAAAADEERLDFLETLTGYGFDSDAEIISSKHAETVLSNELHAVRDHMEEGKRFRRQFGKTEISDIALYLSENKIDAAWLVGFAQDAEMTRLVKRRLREIQRKGAMANRVIKEENTAKARAIYAGPNPDTGMPWDTKEQCITYLMRAKGWSRSTINGYLPIGATAAGRKRRGGA